MGFLVQGNQKSKQFHLHFIVPSNLSQSNNSNNKKLCVNTYHVPKCCHVDTNCLWFFLSGGSPYPQMDGRKIVSLLQDGYRMPKPKHVDGEL